MLYKDRVLQIILGCEDQSTIDYSMPIRTMLYDALAYEKQWDGATCLHDVIRWSDEQELQEIVPNYKMNLIWAYGQEDIDKFKSDLQYILFLLKYKQEEDKLEKYIEENDEKLQHMNQDTHNAIVALMGSEILEGIESEEGEIRMESKALQAIQRRGEMIGRQEGNVLRLIIQIQKKIQKHKEVSQIADELEENVITIEPIYQLVKEHPDKTKEEIYEMLNL